MRISDMSDKRLFNMADNCTNLSGRDLIDLYLELDHRFHLLPLDDYDFDVFINKLDQVNNELIERLDNNEK